MATKTMTTKGATATLAPADPEQVLAEVKAELSGREATARGRLLAVAKEVAFGRATTADARALIRGEGDREEFEVRVRLWLALRERVALALERPDRMRQAQDAIRVVDEARAEFDRVTKAAAARLKTAEDLVSSTQEKVRLASGAFGALFQTMIDEEDRARWQAMADRVATSEERVRQLERDLKRERESTPDHVTFENLLDHAKRLEEEDARAQKVGQPLRWTRDVERYRERLSALEQGMAAQSPTLARLLDARDVGGLRPEPGVFAAAMAAAGPLAKAARVATIERDLAAAQAEHAAAQAAPNEWLRDTFEVVAR
jgi:hypothetical protein